jgi:hypothetical protein
VGDRRTGDEVEVQVRTLLAGAPEIARAGTWIDHGVRDAMGGLLGLGSFWGDDEAGRRFGAAYQPQQSELLKLAGVLSGQLDGIADGIRQMAKRYGVAEEQATARTRRLDFGPQG